MSALYTELEFAIKHLPPSIPEEMEKQIWDIFHTLKKGGNDEGALRDAMIAIGKLEWPHRKAYEDMMMACCSKTQQEMLLESLSENTRKKFIGIGGNDATVQEVVHSKLFEEKLTAEQRYEIQEAALEARLKMHEFMKGQISARPKEYEDRYNEALGEQTEIEKLLKDLETLASVDDDWRDEIVGRVEQMRLGWSIAEPDVTIDDAQKEIEYWKGTLGSGA
jgi:hypothetical protein